MPLLSPKELEGMKFPSPGPDEYWQDSKWADDHFAEIVKNFPNQWVAVVNAEVVASGKTIAYVEKKAKEKTGREEFPIYFAEKGIRVY